MSTTKASFDVKGMKCDGCIERARQVLTGINGVIDARFDLEAGTVVVEGNVDPQAIVEALTGIGYPAAIRSE